MEFLKTNARAIIILLLTGGILFAIATSGDSNQNQNTSSANTAAQEQSSQESDTDEQSQANDEASEESVTTDDQGFNVVVKQNDNQTVLIRSVVDRYLSELGEEFSAEQRLYMETNIVNTLSRNDLIYPGDEFKVAFTTVEEYTNNAKQLSETQLRNWSKYL